LIGNEVKKSNIAVLQTAQQRHDVVAHWDIVALGTVARVRHLVLHFSKYVGRFAENAAIGKGIDRSLVVDAAIIALSLANTLNIELGDEESSPSAKSSDQELFHLLAGATGRMAKALESLDHLEVFNYRGVLEIEARLVFSCCKGRFSEEEFDEIIFERWKKVETSRTFRNGPGTRIEEVKK
jgi:hypothetical protein